MSDLPDYYAGGADIVLRPEWAAVEGTDKNITAETGAIAPNVNTTVLTYTVTTGKTLYVQTSLASLNGLAGNVVAYLHDNSVRVCSWGGAQGPSAHFAKPQVFESGHVLTIVVAHYAATDGKLDATVIGYEV